MRNVFVKVFKTFWITLNW